jgi:glycosyltransferase involved in cell wall biosynthesis
MPTDTILYMSGTVPKRSETFVYREIFALRSSGVRIATASVHKPAHDLNYQDLKELAKETVELYSLGATSILVDFGKELVTHPVTTMKTTTNFILDGLFSKDVTLSRRLKVVWQGVTGIALAHRVRALRIIHIHSHMAHVPTTIAMYAAKQLGISFSFTGHANDLFPNRTLLEDKLKRSLFVNCISHWHREFYNSIVSRPDINYPVVRCGVDTSLYPQSHAPMEEILEILSVGRLVEKKGFDVLIKAVGKIAEDNGIKFKVTIAGSGPEEENLNELIGRLPDPSCVRMLGDTDNAQVMELMSKTDLFVLPCRVAKSGDRDGIPVVLMEAMAQGRCVVSGDLETIRELIEDGRSGVMILPGDQASLEETLIKLAHNRELINELGVKARQRIVEEFDLMLNAARIKTSFVEHGLLQSPASERDH